MIAVSDSVEILIVEIEDAALDAVAGGLRGMWMDDVPPPETPPATAG